MILCGDHSKHMNHSAEPNLLDLENGYKNVAARDIAVGEELTCNYYDFDLAANAKLGLA
jgi:SET domain-containing protein